MTFNFYDASENKMYYNVVQVVVPANNLENQIGELNITGNGDFCSNNGSNFVYEEYCLLGLGCDSDVGGSFGPWDTFDPIGANTLDCGYFGCADPMAINPDIAVGIDPVINDFSCLFMSIHDFPSVFMTFHD